MNARHAISEIRGEGGNKAIDFTDSLTIVDKNSIIFKALHKLSPELGLSYNQVKIDLQDDNRLSWAGTAHEIREIVANVLRLLASDNEVMKQSWFKLEVNTSGPTQKQRVRYILELQNGGSKQGEVIGLVASIDGLVADLVRATYSRASDAAHRLKGRKEANRLLMYFEAFAYDLLNL